MSGIPSPAKLFVLLAFLLMLPTASAQRVNLAKFQTAVAVSEGGDTNRNEAVDGIVSNASRWYSETNANSSHWLEVRLKAPYAVGSAHLYTGLDDWREPEHVEIQYHDGASWVTIPSTVRTNNGATDLVLSFGGAITASRFRAFSNDSILRIKEFALFRYNDGQGYPLGTDVILGLGRDREAVGSSTNSSNHPMKAIDGWVDNNSRYLAANSNGPHTLTIDLGSQQKIGGIHLYTGTGNNSNVLANFDIETNDDSGWVGASLESTTSGTISGHSIVGSDSEAVAIHFANRGIDTKKVRLTFAVPYGRIREFVVLPANEREDGSHGYPLGAGVTVAPRPGTNFKDYHDAWHRIQSRFDDYALLSDANGSTQVMPNVSVPTEEKHYQLLYSKANDAYRIRARDSGNCLEVKDASTSAGAAIVEGDYSAAPHQLWKLQATSGGYFRIVNVYSGMAIQTDGNEPATVDQQPIANTDLQEWETDNSVHYFRKGTGGWVGSFGASWGYDWARNDKDGLGIGQFYVPMQHNGGWPNWGTLHKKYHDWNNDFKPAFLLGFNEPDRPDQANMTSAKAIEHWPKLMAMDIPLVSPATALGGEDWLNNFVNKANDRGYRCEYAGAHWYAGPSSDALLNHIDYVQSRAGGKPVWLTEFSVVDWSGGSGNWSEETNYAFLMNFLWRAETKNNLRKYAIFIFSGGVPEDPWDRTNPRSNFRQGNGNLHAFGKLYAAWDGDRTVREDEPYMLHFYAAMNRLRNANGTVSQRWIRSEDDDIQWVFRDAGNGNLHVISLADGRRLAFNGVDIHMAAPHSVGSTVEWDHSDGGNYGLRYLDHPATGRRLRLRREIANDSASFTLDHIGSGNHWEAARFRPIKPWNKASTAPPAKPDNPDVTPGAQAWTLNWSPSSASDHHSYNVYRRVQGTETWTRIAGGVTATTFHDPTVVEGVVYEYALTDVDLVGFESALSTSEAIDLNASYVLWAASHDLSGANANFEEDYDGDGLPNGLEFAMLSDPKTPNGAPVQVSGDPSRLALTFHVNAAAEASITWRLEESTDLQQWDDVPFTVILQRNFGTMLERTISPDNPPGGGDACYRLGILSDS